MPTSDAYVRVNDSPYPLYQSREGWSHSGGTAMSDGINASRTVPGTLTDILDAVETLAQREDRVTVENVTETFGRASSAVLVLLPAVIGRNRLWLPGCSR